MHRARAHEQMDDFEASVADFQKAHELDGENNEIRQGLERAQKLLKNSNKRDYYKILGVARNADKRTITKVRYWLALFFGLSHL
jgi:DnaJ family protein C protein 3